MTELIKKYHVRFLDKNEKQWYILTKHSVSKDEAEQIWNDQTYYGQLHSEIKDNDKLFFEIIEAFEA